MTNWNRPLTYFVGLAVILLPLAFTFRETSSARTADVETTAAARIERRPASLGAATDQPNKAQIEDAVLPIGQKTSAAAETLSPAARLQLREYSLLNSKVLLRDQERLRKMEILEDPEFLKSIGEFLKRGGDGQLETAAIESLLEARRFNHAGTADQVLQGIVQDARIEDEQLALGDREQLAETKAELMYLWTAANPKAGELMPQYLPGEVSQRLWVNVQTLQSQNLQASREIEDRYAVTGSHLQPHDGFKVGE